MYNYTYSNEETLSFLVNLVKRDEIIAKATNYDYSSNSLIYYEEAVGRRVFLSVLRVVMMCFFKISPYSWSMLL